MITIRGHEKKIAILSFLLAVGLAAAGYFASSAYIGGLLANIASTFLGLSIGLYIVNIYLDREEGGRYLFVKAYRSIDPRTSQRSPPRSLESLRETAVGRDYRSIHGERWGSTCADA